MKTLLRLAFLFCLCTTLLAEEQVYQAAVQSQVLLRTETDSAGQKIVYPAGNAEITGVFVTIPVGAQTGWHIHPSPCVAYVLEGEVTVQLEDGRKNLVRAGQAFAEVFNLKHNGTNTGKIPAKLVLFALGTKGAPVSEKR